MQAETNNSRNENDMLALVVSIAMACNQVNKAYCESNGDFTCQDWDQLSDELKRSAVNGVLFRLENPNATPEDQHNAWRRSKIKDGWVYGPVKNVEAKLHPSLVDYKDLPQEQRTKDNLFMAVVDSLSAIFGV